MDNIIIKWLEEIKSRCKEQNIDTDGCLIMFERNQTYLNGEEVSGYAESKDGRWMCVPIYNDEFSSCYDGYVYSPQCFEIKDKMTTYLSNGSMWTLTTVWLLMQP